MYLQKRSLHVCIIQLIGLVLSAAAERFENGEGDIARHWGGGDCAILDDVIDASSTITCVMQELD